MKSMISHTIVPFMTLCISISMLLCIPNGNAFVPAHTATRLQPTKQRSPQPSALLMAATGEEKAAPLITGADLEVLLADLDTPLVIDAYATWYVLPFDDDVEMINITNKDTSIFGTFTFVSKPKTHAILISYFNRCGPCLLMAPEFEEAAQELKGKVRFAKLDTDQDEAMAARLNIMGLPTLLFLDKYVVPDGEEDTGARAVLKGRIEGALRKQNILDLCNYHFFDGPEPRI